MFDFIKYRSVHLMGMLVHCKIKYILYYEVLDIPLPEMQCLKTLRVAFHHAKKDEVVILNHRLPKQTTVGDYLNEIKAEVELSHSNAELRLLAVFYHKIHKIPEEEKNLGPNDSLIHVHHFTKLIAHNQMVMYPLLVHNFGDPFILVIHEGEALADVKLRIQKKLQVPDEEFSTWKFASMTFGHPEYLNDSDIVSSHFQNSDVFMAWEQQYLGLEHSDTTPKRAYTVNQNRHTFEKPAEEGPAVQTAVEELPPPSLILQETAPPPPPAEQAAAEKELPPTGLVDTNNSLDEEMVVEAPPTGSRFR